MSGETAAAPGAALDPSIIAATEQLSISAREIALGAMSGLHSAKRRGASVEFAEHKEYAPGDDVRRIDWRAYARFDRYYLKQFQDEANLRLFLVVDASGSMGYGDGTRGRNKLQMARLLAGGLAHLALSQRDAVGLCVVRDGGVALLPPRTRTTHFDEILSQLVQAKPAGKANFADALLQLTELTRGRGLCVVLSDLLDKPTPLDALELLSARGLEVATLHIMHPDERDFPFETPSFFASMEDSRRLFVQPRILRAVFVEEMEKFRAQAAVRLAAARVDHQLVWTDAHPAEQLSAFLSRRMALKRARA